MIGPALRATICLPTYNELANLERMVRTLQPLLREGDRILVIDDGSPDGTGEVADRLAAELGVRRRAASPGEGGPRAGVPGRLPAGARRRGGARARDGLRLLARPGRRAATDRRRRGGRRPGARLALRAGRRRDGLGPRAAGDLARRLDLRRALPAHGREGPDRRLQVLPADGARDDRPRRDHRAGLRVPDRDDVSRAARGIPHRRDPDHVLRPRRSGIRR